MKALSIRQPWSWAILAGGKDVENRSWYCRHRGLLAIHAGASLREYAETSEYLWAHFDLNPPAVVDCPRGAIVGLVEVVDCVRRSSSRWFEGPFGIVLRNPQPIAPIPLRGQLGLFELPPEVVAQIEAAVRQGAARKE